MPTCTRGTSCRRCSSIRLCTRAARSSRSKRWLIGEPLWHRTPEVCPTRSGRASTAGSCPPAIPPPSPRPSAAPYPIPTGWRASAAPAGRSPNRNSHGALPATRRSRSIASFSADRIGPIPMKIMDREWREAADLRPSRVGLAFALLAAALLRMWSLGHGIPYSPGVDEPEIMDRAVRMIHTGDFNPHFFDYPSLYIYIQAVVAVGRFLLGAVRGEWASLAAATTSDFYLWGRAVTALLGTATVWLIYLGGLRWGARTALLAAALLAVMPLHVRESHYVLTDVPVTFFVTLTFVLSLRAHERST